MARVYRSGARAPRTAPQSLAPRAQQSLAQPAGVIQGQQQQSMKAPTDRHTFKIKNIYPRLPLAETTVISLSIHTQHSTNDISCSFTTTFVADEKQTHQRKKKEDNIRTATILPYKCVQKNMESHRTNSRCSAAPWIDYLSVEDKVGCREWWDGGGGGGGDGRTKTKT